VVREMLKRLGEDPGRDVCVQFQDEGLEHVGQRPRNMDRF
jgi:hypothetical protein